TPAPFSRSVSFLPGADTRHMLNYNMRNIPSRHISRRKLRTRPYISLSQPMQQLRRTTFRNVGAPRDNKVVVQSTRLSARLHRERHTGILLNVLHFLYEPR